MTARYLRDADELLLPVVRQSIAAHNLADTDAAAARLAEQYAALIDEATTREDRAWALRWIGPNLAACLAELGLTPAARAAITKGTRATPAPQVKSELDKMREARARSSRA